MTPTIIRAQFKTFVDVNDVMPGPRYGWSQAVKTNAGVVLGLEGGGEVSIRRHLLSDESGGLLSKRFLLQCFDSQAAAQSGSKYSSTVVCIRPFLGLWMVIYKDMRDD